MKQDLKQLKIEAKKELQAAQDLKKLDEGFKKYLGKRGEITAVFSFLKRASGPEKKKLGQEANLLKKELTELVEKKRRALEKAQRDLGVSREKIDVTRPGMRPEKGRLHPLTLVMRECCEIFQSMGFEVVQGPEVDSEWYNFDALNMPKDHPARDMQDTFWISQELSKDSRKNFLPRTHTSPVQVRYMEAQQPPLRIVVPGRVFRNEATDASHEVQFYQLEGLMVDKEVSAANFKAIIEEFLKRFFKADVEIRLRPGFFPFTEPSFEIDARKKKGPWLELMGAGMVHPNVFKAAGLLPHQPDGRGWQGFAFGVGLDRVAMVRHKINDIRLFYQNDLRFLKQF